MIDTERAAMRVSILSWCSAPIAMLLLVGYQYLPFAPTIPEWINLSITIGTLLVAPISLCVAVAMHVRAADNSSIRRHSLAGIVVGGVFTLLYVALILTGEAVSPAIYAI